MRLVARPRGQTDLLSYQLPPHAMASASDTIGEHERSGEGKESVWTRRNVLIAASAALLGGIAAFRRRLLSPLSSVGKPDPGPVDPEFAAAEKQGFNAKDTAVAERRIEAKLALQGYSCKVVKEGPQKLKLHVRPMDRKVAEETMSGGQDNHAGSCWSVCAAVAQSIADLNQADPTETEGNAFSRYHFGLHLELAPSSLERNRPALSQLLARLATVERSTGNCALEGLRLSGGRFAQVADDVLPSELQPQLSALATVEMNNTDVSDEDVQAISRAAPALSDLLIHDNPSVSAASLQGFQHLKLVGVSGTKIRPKDVANLLARGAARVAIRPEQDPFGPRSKKELLADSRVIVID